MFRPHYIHLALRFTRKTYRFLTMAVLIAGLVFVTLVLSVRFYFLPDINRYREPIAQVISNSLKQRVTIGEISGSWTGGRASLAMHNVIIHDQEDRPALELANVDAQLAWRSLLFGEVRLHSLVIDQPDLVVRRDPNGRLFVAGVPILLDSKEGKFSEWLLNQVEVQVRRARVAWFDEQRGAPPLMFSDVEFRLQNTLGQHRMSVRATPAPDYGAAIEFAGDFRRKPNVGIGGFIGKSYLRCAYMNLGAIRTWVDLPVDIIKGAGAFDVWADVEERGLSSVTTDLRMVAFEGQFASDAPPLRLKKMQGRLFWRALASGFEAQSERLALMMADGRVMPETDFAIRQTVSGSNVQRTELQSNVVDITTLAEIVKHLPLDAEVRGRIAQHAPRGKLENFKASWVGPAKTPTQMQAEARVQRLAAAPVGRIPGFSGLSGQFKLTPQGGALVLDSTNAALAMPRILANPVSIEKVKAQVEWQMVDGLPQIQVKQASFANADAAGQVTGSYQAIRGGPGKVNMVATLSRADAQAVWKYVPLIVHENVRTWLKSGLTAGYSNDTKFTVRGNLRDFPFDDEKSGLFEVVSLPKGVTLEYVPGWPKLENAEGKLLFRARRMEIEAAGTILGAKVSRSTIEVADLSVADPVVEIKGNAAGPSQDFLRYVNQSGMSKLVGGITEKMRASGVGELELTTKLPLKHVKDVKLQGVFAVTDNTLDSGGDIPKLSKLTGKLEFSETKAQINAKADAFGGPLSFNVSGNVQDGIVVVANGRATAGQLQKEFESPWLARLSGETNWKGTATVKNKRLDLLIESDLRGLSTGLPAPLAKAKDEILPFKLQRRTQEREELISVALGKRLSAELAFVAGADPLKLRRGHIDFGPNAKLPTAGGLMLTGALTAIDADEWLSMMETARAKGDAAGGSFDFAGADLKAGSVEIFGRTIHGVRLNVKRGQGLWEGRLASNEVEGRVDWVPEGRGKLIARLARLHIPEAEDADRGTQGEAMSGRDLPALDIVAEDFRFGQYDLGVLTLKATPNGPGWRLDGLDIQNPDGTVVAQGGWQFVDGKPRSQMSVWIDVSNVGNFLRRIRYPDTVRDGTAKLIGDVSWQGSPQRIDYPTLSGNFTLEARKGRFLKAEPGIGKLIGILSLQALPRRITLDFRDVFRQGFAFDDIEGDFRVVNGRVQTKKDLSMNGPAARVRMSGEVDLAAEKQNLYVRVLPSVSDGVAVGATILNPLVGIATFLAGKVLNDPLDQIITFEYRVSGDLTEPIVEKVVRQPKQQKSGRE